MKIDKDTAAEIPSDVVYRLFFSIIHQARGLDRGDPRRITADVWRRLFSDANKKTLWVSDRKPSQHELAGVCSQELLLFFVGILIGEELVRRTIPIPSASVDFVFKKIGH